MPFYVNTKKPDSSREIARLLEKCIKRHKRDWAEIVFLCIGSDRVTGDCLSDITDFISRNHPFALVIAIDASLGDERHLGYVTIGNGSLYPGAAVQKDLPPVGDIYITGIVNIAGILEYLTLQTTRLSTVITLADTIAQGILGNFI